MVKHIIIWHLKDEFSEKEKIDAKKKIKAGLEGLKGKIDGLLEIKVNIDLLDSSSGDMMLDSLFVDENALKGYQKNDDHLKVATFVRQCVKMRSCVDYNID